MGNKVRVGASCEIVRHVVVNRCEFVCEQPVESVRALIVDPRALTGILCVNSIERRRRAAPPSQTTNESPWRRTSVADLFSIALGHSNRRESVQITAATAKREVLVAGSQAHVLYYNSQSKAWQPAGQGPSRVELYRDPARGTYRVVARNIADQSVRTRTHTQRPKTAAH